MGNSNNKLLAALLTGAAIGGALGILFAPAKAVKQERRLLTKAMIFQKQLKKNSEH